MTEFVAFPAIVVICYLVGLGIKTFDNEKLDRFIALRLDGGTDDTSSVTVEHEGLQANQFWSDGIDRCVWTIFEEYSALL